MDNFYADSEKKERFRNARVGVAAVIRKFYYQVFLNALDMHMQRLLWTDMDRDKDPLTYLLIVCMIDKVFY